MEVCCSVKGLTVQYPGLNAPVLKAVELTVSPGECIMIGGLSGSGKSTLLRAIADVLPGSAEKSGEVTFSQRYQGKQPRLGWIHQNPETQLFCLTPREEIRYGLELAGYNGNVERTIEDYLTEFNLLHRADALNRTLSSGEKQLLLVATVLASQPSLLLLDEPTSFMAPAAAGKFLQALAKLKQQGSAIIMVEHNRFVQPVLDRILLLEDGAMSYQAPAHPFPEHHILQRFGLEPGETAKLPLTPGAKTTELVVEGLTFKYGSQSILRNVDACLDSAHLHILHGHNGSGKSTLLHLLAGYLKPQNGKFWFNRQPANSKRRRGLTYCIFALPERQFLTTTVRDELTFGGLKPKDSEALERVVASFNLGSLWNRSIRELSMGQKQRLVLAASMVQRRDIFLMDEPTLGMDWQHIKGMMNMVSHCLREGKTIVIATHHQALAELYGQRKHELRDGMLVSK